MSDKKPSIIDRCKNLKAVFDAFSILKKLGVVLGFLGSLGGIGYFTIDIDEPEYALKGHTHTQPIQIIIDHAPAIKKAIDEYDKKHDPQKLGH